MGLVQWRRAGEAASKQEELQEGNGEGALEGGEGGLGELLDRIPWEVLE